VYGLSTSRLLYICACSRIEFISSDQKHYSHLRSTLNAIGAAEILCGTRSVTRAARCGELKELPEQPGSSWLDFEDRAPRLATSSDACACVEIVLMIALTRYLVEMFGLKKVHAFVSNISCR